MKLALGTAQFGLDYGISNKNGQVPLAEMEAILDYAQRMGIHLVDTAALYGDSEMRLGALLRSRAEMRVVTKISVPASEVSSALAPMLEQSLKNLQRSTLHAVLFHNVEALLCNLKKAPLYVEELKELKKKQFVQKIGVSVYSVEQVRMLLSFFTPDIIQFPMNILHQEFEPLLEELKSKNIELHVRSVFLQGLLLMEPAALPSYLNALRSTLIRLREAAKEQGMSLVAYVLSYLVKNPYIDKIIVGVTSRAELIEIDHAYKKADTSNTLNFSPFACTDPQLMDPRYWAPKQEQPESIR